MNAARGADPCNVEPQAATGAVSRLGCGRRQGISRLIFDQGGRVAWSIRLVEIGADGEGSMQSCGVRSEFGRL